MITCSSSFLSREKAFLSPTERLSWTMETFLGSNSSFLTYSRNNSTSGNLETGAFHDETFLTVGKIGSLSSSVGLLLISRLLKKNVAALSRFLNLSQSSCNLSLSILGSFSKPRRRRQRELHQTKGLMSRTIAVHVRFESLYISLPSSAKQQREMTKFYVFWRTRTAMANFWYLL